MIGLCAPPSLIICCRSTLRPHTHEMDRSSNSTGNFKLCVLVVVEEYSWYRSADVLSGRHFVWTVLCDIFFRRSGLDVLSGPPHGWLGVVTSSYGWLWGGFMVVTGGFGWLRVVTSCYAWLWGGHGWLLVVMVGYGLVTSGYRWYDWL